MSFGRKLPIITLTSSFFAIRFIQKYEEKKRNFECLNDKPNPVKLRDYFNYSQICLPKSFITTVYCQSKSKMDIYSWAKEFDVKLENMKYDKETLYKDVLEAKDKFGDDAEILWRLSKATHLLSIAVGKNGNKNRMKELDFEALDYAKKSVEKDPSNSNCHKWCAITIGTTNSHVSTKEKILNGHEVRKHVNNGLELNPTDTTLHHLLGRWCSEIASLSWIEVNLANVLFAKCPTSSYEEALDSYLKAYEYDKTWIENILGIVETCIKLKRIPDVKKWIGEGLSKKVEGESEEIAFEKLTKLKEIYG